MASRKSAAPRAIPGGLKELLAADLQLRIELMHIEPHVWRRVIVPETVTLAKLHQVLQAAMGWTDSHLHEYVIARKRYGTPDPDWPSTEPVLDERRVQLKPFIEARVRRFIYLYDFGDHWEHEITVEDLVVPKNNARRIVCTAGENACPPEDVGGEPGYANFLQAIADPHHEQHQELQGWIGYPFDPHAFDLNAVNQRLARIKA
jgi:Plasmid pRiA4b ORF-3-like protein